MSSVSAASLWFILEVLQYERLPGSNNPVSEHWVSPEQDLFFFPYFRRGDSSSFLEQPSREFLNSLPPSSLRRLKAALENKLNKTEIYT